MTVPYAFRRDRLGPPAAPSGTYSVAHARSRRAVSRGPWTRRTCTGSGAGVGPNYRVRARAVPPVPPLTRTPRGRMYSLAACRTVLPVGVTYHSYRRRPRSASRRDEHHGTWSHTRVGLADGTWSYSACDARQQADVLRLGHARQTRENS